MTSGEPSRSARIMSWLVIGLAVVLLVWGIAQYGWSSEVHQRFWGDIVARATGPMTFRFYLQPTMAAIAAFHDGVRDARTGHRAFIWTALLDPRQHAGRLRQGAISTARIMLLGLSMDVIYQFKVLHRFYPVEALVIAILLAVLPYYVFRWIVEMVARRRFARRSTGSAV